MEADRRFDRRLVVGGLDWIDYSKQHQQKAKEMKRERQPERNQNENQSKKREEKHEETDGKMVGDRPERINCFRTGQEEDPIASRRGVSAAELRGLFEQLCVEIRKRQSSGSCARADATRCHVALSQPAQTQPITLQP